MTILATQRSEAKVQEIDIRPSGFNILGLNGGVGQGDAIAINDFPIAGSGGFFLLNENLLGGMYAATGIIPFNGLTFAADSSRIMAFSPGVSIGAQENYSDSTSITLFRLGLIGQRTPSFSGYLGFRTAMNHYGFIEMRWDSKNSEFQILRAAFETSPGTALVAGAVADNNDASPVSDQVFTTVDRTIVPRAVPTGNWVAIDDPANFADNGYGLWDYGPGVPHTRRTDLMLENYDASAVTESTRLMRFFTMTDVHITDKESPAQAIIFKDEPALRDNAISVYSPLMLYTTHVLEAAVKTINRLHMVDPLDFGLTLGDMANSAQYNELRWFIDLMDGNLINPDSGAKDDPIPGPYNDYQDEFQAEGLNPEIPWYAAIGNHDHLWMGSKAIDAQLAAVMVGEQILQMGNIITDPDPFSMRTYSTGFMDGSTLYGSITGAGIVAEMSHIPTTPADPDRRPLSKVEVMQEYSNSTSSPAGHGFQSANLFQGCYSFEPIADLPFKVIVLDNTMDSADPNPPGGIYGYGTLNNGRYEWLMDQLQTGQAENKLMIVAAHIPIGVNPESLVGWLPSPPNYTSETNLIRRLQNFPNLILWLAGHRHLNQVTAFPSANNARPEYGFWQVETKSLREFPQQFRTIDIVHNDDNTLSIFATAVDPAVSPGSFADISRSYAIASSQILGLIPPPPSTGPTVANAELIVPLSPAMQAVIKGMRPPRSPWRNFERHGDWLHGWLGWISDVHAGHIYHKELGFLRYKEASNDTIWFYLNCREMDSFATSSSYYPYCYNPELGWLFHAIGTDRFYNLTTGQWFSLSDNSESLAEYIARNNPLITAHRGYAEIAPENTMSAFAAALHAGADACEFDVHMTLDNTLVVFHDDSVERTTNGTGKLSELTYDYLSTLDAGGWKDPKFAGERIPTLHQTLTFFEENRMVAVLEIKVAGIVDAVLAMLYETKMDKRTVIISFEESAIAKIKSENPGIPALLLLHGDPYMSGSAEDKANNIAAKANEIGTNYVGPFAFQLESIDSSRLPEIFYRLQNNIDPGRLPLALDPETIAILHEMGFLIDAWTVDSEENIRDLVRSEVDILTTNYLERAIRIKREVQKR